MFTLQKISPQRTQCFYILAADSGHSRQEELRIDQIVFAEDIGRLNNANFKQYLDLFTKKTHITPIEAYDIERLCNYLVLLNWNKRLEPLGRDFDIHKLQDLLSEYYYQEYMDAMDNFTYASRLGAWKSHASRVYAKTMQSAYSLLKGGYTPVHPTEIESLI